VATIIGTGLNDVLAGTPDPDHIEGGAGNDRINGGAGDDVILGGTGSDILTGDAGNDQIFGEGGNDGIYGGGGNDVIDGGAGDDILFGDGGNDTILGGTGNDTLYGGTGDDTFVWRTGDGNDTFFGGTGNDTLELHLSSADITDALRAELAAYQAWASGQVTTAGSAAILAGQTTGATFSFASLGISMSVVEGLTLLVDGQQVAIDSLINRPPSDVTLSNQSVAENAAAGTVVGLLSGTDPDAGQSETLSFALASPSDHFEIVGNQLVVKSGAVLDFETTPSVNVSVTATDTTGLKTTKTLTIALQNVNEAATGTARISGASIDHTAGTATLSATHDLVDADGMIGEPTYQWRVSTDGGATWTDIDGARENTYTPSGDAIGALVQVTVSYADAFGQYTSISQETFIVGNGAINALNGSAHAEVILGLGGNDVIVGFDGTDMIDGSTGTDTLLLSGSSEDLDVAADEHVIGIEAVTAANATSGVSLDLSNQTEGFAITGSAFADTIRGSAGADVINGGSGNDVIVGFVGADRINGGSGKDTLVLSATSAELNAATNTQLSSVEAVSALAAAGSVVINLSNQTEGFTITGSAFADSLTGGRGNDTFIGFTLGDTISGGTGTDTLRLQGSSAALDAASDADIQGVEAISFSGVTVPVTVDLSRQTEGFTVTGTNLADTIRGSAGADRINAGSGNDVILGYVGDDRINGGSGTNALHLFETSEDLNNAANDRLISVQIVTAAAAAAAVTISLANQTEGFSIIGSAFADVLTGGLGNDTFQGMNDGDVLNGGAGTDTLRLTATSAPVNGASDAQIVNVEAITFSGAAAAVNLDLSLQSDGFTVTGTNHADTIRGSTGADTLNTGSGNDVILDFVGMDRLNGGSGTDTLQITATSADLNNATNAQISSIEAVSAANAAQGVVINLSNQSEGFALTGSAFADVLTGGAGSDTIQAGAGDDTIVGFVGSDTVNGGEGYDTIVLTQTSTTLNSASGTRISNVEAVSASAAAAGVTIDLSRQTEGFTVTGSDWADTLIGSTGRDVITGGAGNDVIRGGAGADVLTGGEGADTFVFASTSESGPSAAARDQILDFVSTLQNGVEHDVIDLSAIDAISGGANDAFTFNPTAWDGVGNQFTGAGQLRYQFVTDANGSQSTIISGNVNSNLAADFQIVLAGHITLSATDFIL
jgi:Ca2+-binding RTX toxin-like protein